MDGARERKKFMKRRPFVFLTLLFTAAAAVQAMLSPASTPSDFEGDLPPGMVCTACGPIPTGDFPIVPPSTRAR